MRHLVLVFDTGGDGCFFRLIQLVSGDFTIEQIEHCRSFEIRGSNRQGNVMS